jgi:hypothetical protein
MKTGSLQTSFLYACQEIVWIEHFKCIHNTLSVGFYFDSPSRI